MSQNIIEVHISEIRVGDTIVCLDGYERTVTPQNIKKDKFMGVTLFGDSYKLGTIKVKKVNYA